MRVSEAREIAPGVFLLTAGTGPMASNLYLVKSGAAWMLVDAGWAGSAQPVRAAVERLLGPGATPVLIALTHIHPGHSGGAGALSRLWQLPVYVHPAELPMAAGKYVPEFSMPLDRWIIAPLMRLVSARRRHGIEAAGDISDVVQPLGPRGELPGVPGWVAVSAPGHTPGHVAYWRSSDRVLITGDAVVTVNLNSLQGILLGRPDLAGPPRYTTWNWRTAMESIAVLAGLGPALLAPGHGQPLGIAVVPRLRGLAARRQGLRRRSGQRAGAPKAVWERLRRRLPKRGLQQ
ncbi:MAG: MBL fold metallo-hydrolase [Pseudarthrobacter sp.]|nr:MBL fold metallo-hydrolase [Pseudarthrobacter sp.]